MTGQLDIFTALTAPAPTQPEPDDAETNTPPKRTQMKGPLPGETWQDAFGGEAA